MIDLDAMDKDQWQTWPVKKEELRGLVHEIERMRAALWYYASDAAWTCTQVEGADGDYGRIARAALAGEKADDAAT